MNWTIHDQSRLIDRLVDGQLSDDERSELLSRLDQSADGWRTLALAFLEAQTWHAALHAARDLKPQVELRLAAMAKPRRERSLLWLATCVATALLAFGVGRSRNVPQSPVEQTVKQPVKTPSVATHSPTQSAAPQTIPQLTPDARQVLERHGYRVQERPRVVSLRRPDGQTVQMLVNEVEVRYVGSPYSL
jgi:anti-sigma factor RsiW